MGYCSGAMEAVTNELVPDVYGWQLNIVVPYHDGRDDGIQASTGFNQLSRRSGTGKCACVVEAKCMYVCTV